MFQDYQFSIDLLGFAGRVVWPVQPMDGQVSVGIDGGHIVVLKVDDAVCVLNHGAGVGGEEVLGPPVAVITVRGQRDHLRIALLLSATVVQGVAAIAALGRQGTVMV